MGSVVEYRCGTCTFSTGELRIGWGKSGRAKFWGGLVSCEPCGALGVADIATRSASRDGEPHCGECDAPLKRLEGTSVPIACPRCRRSSLGYRFLGSWS